MAQKCVHKGCGKDFADPEEECRYHPGPPEFHEGQKGWKCCKPRVLTFDEFLAIPPCTTGKHSTIDDTPAPPPKPIEPESPAAPVPVTRPLAPSLAAKQATRTSTPKPEPPEDESDDPDATIIPGMSCKRRGCGASRDEKVARDAEECVFHPGLPLFHEGSKGWTCCKRRVLEFDEFMKIEGCKTRSRHCYIGKKKQVANGAPTTDQGETLLTNVRNDYYQTGSTVIASFYLKKIDATRARVDFKDNETDIELDLPTSDGQRYKTTVPLFAAIMPSTSQFKIMGTKLELVLVKKDGTSWPTLRRDEKGTGERIQVGRAGRV